MKARKRERFPDIFWRYPQVTKLRDLLAMVGGWVEKKENISG